MLHLLKLFLVLVLTFVIAESCVPLTFESDSFVCVCTSADDCDFIGDVVAPSDGFFTAMTSTIDELRFDVQTYPMNVDDAANATLRVYVNVSDTRQTMTGFGGAFTDATGINIATLSTDLQDLLIRQYFAAEGLEYNVGRIPIAGCDFSTHPYSYDDVEGDVDLLFFELAPEDFLYKLPYIQRAIEVTRREIRLFGSPWAPPSWMKTNGMFNGTGGLLPEMHQPWANYFVKFIEAYNDQGAPIWGVTAQNEPTEGLYNDYKFNGCGFTPEAQRDFVKGFLGPTLSSSGHEDIILMITDENRSSFPDYPVTVLEDPEAAQYVDGTAVHWYDDRITPPSMLDNLHNQFPDKFIMYTEACGGFAAPDDERVILGYWGRAEQYVEDIIEDVNHWSTGWVDWNMALDMQGGPNWVSNFVDSPIIVNADTNEFYRQPMFYAMGHFSKLIPEGSRALGSTMETTTRLEGVRTAAFLDPSNNVVIVLINRFHFPQTILIEDSNGHSTTFNLPRSSIHTIIYPA